MASSSATPSPTERWGQCRALCHPLCRGFVRDGLCGAWSEGLKGWSARPDTATAAKQAPAARRLPALAVVSPASCGGSPIAVGIRQQKPHT